MDCPNKEILFNYYSRELEQAEVSRISNHIEECGRCRRVLHEIDRNVSLVNGNLDLLEPDRIPERPALSTKQRKAESLGRTRESGFSVLSWKEGARVIALAAILLAVLIGGLLHRNHRPPDFSTAQAVAINEQQYMADAKEDLRERSIYLSVYNEQTGRLEIIRSTATRDTADIEVISLR